MRKYKKYQKKPENYKKTLKKISELYLPYKKNIVVVIVSSIIMSVLKVLAPIYLGNITNLIYKLYMKKEVFSSIINPIIILLFIYIFIYVFQLIKQMFLNKMIQTVAFKLRNKINKKINTLEFAEIENIEEGNIVSLVVSDITNINQGVNKGFSQIIDASITFVGIIVMIFTISVPLSLITILIIPVLSIASIYIAKVAQPHYKEQRDALANISTIVHDNFNALDEIKSFGVKNEVINEFDIANEKLYKSMIRGRFFSSLMMPVVKLLSNFSYVIISIIGAVFVINGNINVGQAHAFIIYTKNISNPFSMLAQILAQIQSSLSSLERLDKFLSLKDEIDTGREFKGFNEKIEFLDVSFKYTDKFVLKNLSFKILKNNLTAIVGVTGSGKTTIIKLLLGLYKPTSGIIKIDGININEYSRNSIRNNMSIVLQDGWLLNDTVENNITFLRDDLAHRVDEALENSNAKEFVSKLKDKKDTFIYSDSKLSSGQMQLLTIARSLIEKKDILILDEATSSVDTLTEKRINEALKHLKEDTTSVVIAHRLKTIKDADKIIVIKDGLLIEKGTHKELLNNNSEYKKLYSNL